MLFPKISYIRFQDDSKIKCGSSSTPSLSLPFDYITKYNNTWYGYHFGAKPNPNYYTQPIIDNYNNSLSVLDEPLAPFDEIIMRVPGIKPYETIYHESSSPRDFIARLRLHLGKAYCEKAAILLSVYMQALGVFHLPFWQIDVADLDPIDDISIKEMPQAEALHKLHGGRRQTLRNQGTRSQSERQTLRNQGPRSHKTRKQSRKITYMFTHSPDMYVRRMADHFFA